MQMVIEISEDAYKKLTQKSMLMSASAIDEAVDVVKKGMVLPKGHGRLIDADRLLTIQMRSKYYHLNNGDTAIPIIDVEHAHTVVPADKGGD